MKYVVISPVRNEAQYLPETLATILSQATRPAKWVIVDDGSTDQTAQIVTDAAKHHNWIELVARTDRGFRQSGIGVVEAFYDGFSRVTPGSWDYLAKMDGDVRLPCDYFERLFEEFRKNPKLGICSGDIYVEDDERRVLDSPGDPDFHVRGAAKVYRRACWDEIGGIPRVTGFDCVDNVKARMLGWDTRRFPEPAVIHLRKTGRANGTWRNSVKDGMGARAIGYHPLFLLIKCVNRISRGSLLGGLGQCYGFVKGYLCTIPRVTDQRLIRYLRTQQLNRLLGRETIWR
jgi:glycosyltransferase involved in cell wall biosynthesis